MIIHLRKFINEEKSYWVELESMLDALEKQSKSSFDLEKIKRFHYLYQRATAGLAKIITFSSEQNIRLYLETLIGRAYAEIHETRTRPHRLTPWHWFFHTFPRTFRKYSQGFWISLIIMLVGCTFGGFAITFDPDAKDILIPFRHLKGDPSERVAKMEKIEKDPLKGRKATFSAYLMTHNIKVSILVFALGMTWGMGTIVVLFYNGTLLGATALDYVLSGESKFLLGWLLPHGAIEIPAILLAGQAGLVLAGALIGWGKPVSLRARFRKISADLVTLIAGVALLLVWAGVIEAFFSQYHEPTLPYELKILFGIAELVFLVLFLTKAGRRKESQ
ncbi:stage II sporulation protein M [Thermodesulfobacteriota bacterium]